MQEGEAEKLINIGAMGRSAESRLCAYIRTKDGFGRLKSITGEFGDLGYSTVISVLNNGKSPWYGGIGDDSFFRNCTFLAPFVAYRINADARPGVLLLPRVLGL